MKRFSFLIASTIAAVASMSCNPRPATGCAAAMREGDRLRVNEEMAVIIWEPETKTEHFIRQAQFVTDAADFGFLVPTPTEPVLSETDTNIFWRLNALTEAKVEWRDEVRSVFRFFRNGIRTTNSEPTSAVQVLNRETVAGYDAAVLRASDSSALTEWLSKNDYATRPALEDWLQHYIDNDWVITAFKLAAKDDREDHVVAQPIRLSFKTDVPFYPYREPADMRDPATAGSTRKLRVFFLADQRYESTLGKSQASPAKVAWANRTSTEHPSYGGHLTEAITAAAKLKQGETALVGDCWITEFEDNSAPRNGTDELFFQPSQVQSAVERPTIVRTRTVTNYYPNLAGFTMWIALAIIAAPFFIRAAKAFKAS
ncbi:MAG: DUF2330 domain-containing protein [Planctomycetaceae bacterium]